MPITSQSEQPQQPQGPAKVSFSRTLPGMSGNTAPIAGTEEGPRFREAAQPQRAAARGAEQQADGGEGDEAPDASDSVRLGLLARQDRAARARLQSAEAAERRLKTMEERINARDEQLRTEEAKRAEWRRDPKKLLMDFGFSPEAAMQFMLNKEKLTPDQLLAANLEERLEQERAANEAGLQKLRDEQAQALATAEAEEARQEQERQAEEERVAIEELNSDIGEVLTGDPKSFPLLAQAEKKRPGAGTSAVFTRLQGISDEVMKERGRRPQITTKMLEQACTDVEAAARAEYQELLENEDTAAALQRAPAPRRPNTLTNDLGRRVGAPVREVQQGKTETVAEKTARVKRQLDGILNGARQRG